MASVKKMKENVPPMTKSKSKSKIPVPKFGTDSDQIGEGGKKSFLTAGKANKRSAFLSPKTPSRVLCELPRDEKRQTSIMKKSSPEEFVRDPAALECILSNTGIQEPVKQSVRHTLASCSTGIFRTPVPKCSLGTGKTEAGLKGLPRNSGVKRRVQLDTPSRVLRKVLPENRQLGVKNNQGGEDFVQDSAALEGILNNTGIQVPATQNDRYTLASCSARTFRTPGCKMSIEAKKDDARLKGLTKSAGVRKVRTVALDTPSRVLYERPQETTQLLEENDHSDIQFVKDDAALEGILNNTGIQLSTPQATRHTLASCSAKVPRQSIYSTKTAPSGDTFRKACEDLLHRLSTVQSSAKRQRTEQRQPGTPKTPGFKDLFNRTPKSFSTVFPFSAGKSPSFSGKSPGPAPGRVISRKPVAMPPTRVLFNDGGERSCSAKKKLKKTLTWAETLENCCNKGDNNENIMATKKTLSFTCSTDQEDRRHDSLVDSKTTANDADIDGSGEVSQVSSARVSASCVGSRQHSTGVEPAAACHRDVTNNHEGENESSQVVSHREALAEQAPTQQNSATVSGQQSAEVSCHGEGCTLVPPPPVSQYPASDSNICSDLTKNHEQTWVKTEKHTGVRTDKHRYGKASEQKPCPQATDREKSWTSGQVHVDSSQHAMQESITQETKTTSSTTFPTHPQQTQISSTSPHPTHHKSIQTTSLATGTYSTPSESTQTQSELQTTHPIHFHQTQATIQDTSPTHFQKGLLVPSLEAKMQLQLETHVAPSHQTTSNVTAPSLLETTKTPAAENIPISVQSTVASQQTLANTVHGQEISENKNLALQLKLLQEKKQKLLELEQQIQQQLSKEQHQYEETDSHGQTDLDLDLANRGQGHNQQQPSEGDNVQFYRDDKNGNIIHCTATDSQFTANIDPTISNLPHQVPATLRQDMNHNVATGNIPFTKTVDTVTLASSLQRESEKCDLYSTVSANVASPLPASPYILRDLSDFPQRKLHSDRETMTDDKVALVNRQLWETGSIVSPVPRHARKTLAQTQSTGSLEKLQVPVWTPLALKSVARQQERKNSRSTQHFDSDDGVQSLPDMKSKYKDSESSERLDLLSCALSSELESSDITEHTTLDHTKSTQNQDIYMTLERYGQATSSFPKTPPSKSASRVLKGTSLTPSVGSLSLRGSVKGQVEVQGHGFISGHSKKASPEDILHKRVLMTANERYREALIQEEIELYACRLVMSQIQSHDQSCERGCSNPVAKVLLEGDEMHFVPIDSNGNNRLEDNLQDGSAFTRYQRSK